MGEASAFGDAKPTPLLHLDNGNVDGYRVDSKCMGTYVHGILDNAPFVDFLLRPYADRVKNAETFDYQAFKEQQYDKLADHIRRYVDVPAVYRILETKNV